MELTLFYDGKIQSNYFFIDKPICGKKYRNRFYFDITSAILVCCCFLFHNIASKLLNLLLNQTPNEKLNKQASN